MGEARWRIRAAFVALPLLVLLQHVVTESAEEPYPAVQLPAFGGSVPDADGKAQLTLPHLTVAFRDGGTASLAQDVLLADVRTLRLAVMKRLFYQGRDATGHVTSAPLSGEWQRILRGAPAGRTYDGASRPVTDDPGFRSWLRSRLLQLYPGRVPTSLTVRWVRTTYSLPDGVRVEQQPPVVVVEVPLG